MMQHHPQIIEKDGKKEFVVIPYSEYLALREALEDYEDLIELRQAKVDAQNDSTISLDDVVKELGLNNK